MTRKQDSAKARMTAEKRKQFLAEDQDLLKLIVERTVQQVREPLAEQKREALRKLGDAP